MPESLEATYRIVTPMFIGGGDQTPTDGIRPPSFKGALRFWWRALNWQRYRHATTCDESALILLHDEEARLFGIAAGDQGAGQGRFLLRISQQPKQRIESAWPQNNTGSGYLGYGLMETNEAPHRQGIQEEQGFSVQLTFKPGTQQADIEAIRQALQALGLFGGLGSRARRGFGSLTVLELDGQNLMQDRVEYESAALQRLQAGSTISELPPYTTFSKASGFRILATAKNARQAHAEAGQRYREHRGQASTLRGDAKVPFGLPLQGIDPDSRRASPLFFHVQALRNGDFAAAVLYLPATFHHDQRYQAADPIAFYRDVAQFVKEGDRP